MHYRLTAQGRELKTTKSERARLRRVLTDLEFIGDNATEGTADNATRGVVSLRLLLAALPSDAPEPAATDAEATAELDT